MGAIADILGLSLLSREYVHSTQRKDQNERAPPVKRALENMKGKQCTFV